ncbi:hypothetical protein B0T21DRAFT_361487, partial [Apiosordaria backusii]
MDLCKTPITTSCPWYLPSNDTAGVLPESMLQLHIIVPAVTVFGLIVLGTLSGMVIWVLRRQQAMEEVGVVEGSKRKWYEDSESGSEGSGSVNGGSAPTPTEGLPPREHQTQQQPSPARTEAVRQQMAERREKELPPPPLQIRRSREPTSTPRDMETDMNLPESMAGIHMGVDSMEIIRGGKETALVWANFGPPPKVPNTASSPSPRTKPPAPPPLPSPQIPPSQRPTTRSLIPPPRPYRAPNRNTYPNQAQQQQSVHLHPQSQLQQAYAQPRNLTQSHSHPEMRHQEQHHLQPHPHPQASHTHAHPKNLTQSHSQPEMRQREREQMVLV